MKRAHCTNEKLAVIETLNVELSSRMLKCKERNSITKERGEKMKLKIGKFLIVSLVLVCVLAFAKYPGTSASPQTPRIYVEPEKSVFRTDTTSVGAKFSVNVSTSGWEAPGLWGFDFKLSFDNTLLAATTLSEPAGFFLPGSNVFASVIDNETGFIEVSYAYTTLKGVAGAGPLATVEFEIIKAPPPDLSCDLRLEPLQFLDPNEVEYAPTMEVTHGYYEFTAPKAPVHLKVVPAVVGAAMLDQIVKVDIAMDELRAIDKLVAVGWKLKFDTSLLELLDATEGDFLKSEAEKAKDQTGEEYGTGFSWGFEAGTDFIYSFSLYYKIPWLDVPPEIFPEGSGTLATITLKAIKMPEELMSVDLVLFDAMMLDVDGNEISYDRVEKGVYKAPVELGDLNYDMKIDLRDILVLAKAFGSYPGHPRWDPIADLNADDKVSLLDAIIIAKAFHQS